MRITDHTVTGGGASSPTGSLLRDGDGGEGGPLSEDDNDAADPPRAVGSSGSGEEEGQMVGLVSGAHLGAIAEGSSESDSGGGGARYGESSRNLFSPQTAKGGGGAGGEKCRLQHAPTTSGSSSAV